jgi:hypothetical protein
LKKIKGLLNSGMFLEVKPKVLPPKTSLKSATPKYMVALSFEERERLLKLHLANYHSVQSRDSTQGSGIAIHFTTA